MTLRRISALAIALAMFPLNMARADSACRGDHGDHGDRSSRPAAAGPVDHARHGGTAVSTRHHEHGDAQREGGKGGHDHQQCDAPTRSACCQALATCSFALDATVTDGCAASPDAGGDVTSAAVTAPASRITAPEPPPPKA